MKLATWLTKHNMTQTEFAERIGRGPSYVSQIIAGTIWPSRDVMDDIRTATHGAVSADDFLEDAPDGPQRPRRLAG